MSLLDEFDQGETFEGRVRRTWNGRPYILANPDWDPEEYGAAYIAAHFPGFTVKPGEHRGRSALYTRVTTWISAIEDTFNLGEWSNRGVAYGMALRPSLCVRARNVDVNDDVPSVKTELDAIAQEAKQSAGWMEKANLGTAFHTTTDMLDRGQRLPASLDDTTSKMLDAYAEKTACWEYAHIEQGMVNDTLRTYGTPDRLRYVGQDAHWDSGHRKLRVTDLKTGSIEYGWQKMELQLGCYALSDLYDPDTGIRTELDIDQEYGEIVHVPYGVGTATVYKIPLGPAIEALTDLVPRVRAWRSRKPAWEVAAGEPLRVENTAAVTSALAAAWPTHPPEAL